ncbi:MAG: TetR/AcrR family transcriptional regulator, partial [Betaproteobacteria bacterium]|nr:TetR/AcrR family transcriptional regulator [Betaproteobacteria bacterium]
QYGAAIRKMQREGLLPAGLNHKLVQLAVLSLATYPIAFGQITRLVTGRSAADPRFQREWIKFLRQIGVLLFGR